MSIIFSLGSSLRRPEEFINLLAHYQIRAVVDVRQFPTSRLDHFKRDALNELLKANAIAYFYLGKELGGYRKGGYEYYMKSADFLDGLEKLEDIAHRYVTAFMCAELLPWRCHRRFIGRYLEERGWQVIHILNEKRGWQPKPG